MPVGSQEVDLMPTNRAERSRFYAASVSLRH